MNPDGYICIILNETSGGWFTEQQISQSQDHCFGGEFIEQGTPLQTATFNLKRLRKVKQKQLDGEFSKVAAWARGTKRAAAVCLKFIIYVANGSQEKKHVINED